MKENFNVKGKNGSIAIFVLVGLLFMSSFLIISYGYNVSKSKISKEQFDSISDIYSHKDGDANAYERAYTALRKKNKQTFTKTVGNTSVIELDKTFEENLVNYRIYGKGLHIENYNLPEEYQQVEYIDSTGSQWIDTGVYCDNNTGLEMVFDNKDNLKGNISVVDKFGVYYGDGGYKFYYGATKLVIDSTIKYNTNVYHKLNSTGYYIDNIKVADVNQGEFKTSTTLKIFCYSAGNNNYCTSGRLYNYKLYKNNELIRNFIPCYRKYDSAIGVYDLMEGKFYTNSGTGSFIAGAENINGIEIIKGIGNLIEDTTNVNYGRYKIQVKITNKNNESITKNIILNRPLYTGDYIDFKTKKVVRSNGIEESIDLPEIFIFEDYTKIEVLNGIVPQKIEVEYLGYIIPGYNIPGYKILEYIESTGSEWIDTGVYCDNNTGLEMVFDNKDNLKGNISVVGNFGVYYGDGGYKFYYGATKLVIDSTIKYNTNVYHKLNSTGYYIDNIKVADVNQGEFKTNNTLKIFCYDSGSDKFCTSGRLYNYKLYKNSQLIRNFIPVKRQVDEVIGLYDTVNNVFYANSGTGEFIAGPEV